MKISIKNFGPIDHFEFDLEKDLHVIYGENNIGKSWAIEGLYLLLKFWSEKAELAFRLKLNEDSLSESDTDQAENMSYDLNRSFNNTFGEIKNLFTNSHPKILIDTNALKINLLYMQILMRSVVISNELEVNETIINKDLGNELNTFENLYFLPASKSGIYQVLSNMGNIFAQLSQLPLKNKSLDLPSMSTPISDYILNIAAIQSAKKGGFNDLASILEENVIEGSVIFDELQKKLKYKSKRTGLVSELHEASSMIAEISPLVAYLKYIIPKGNAILFIEEPEAHLHPKVQVEMMKIFVDLAKAGVKVVMTTHSDFMMDTLTNLILDNKIATDKVASYHLVMGEKGSYDAGDMQATEEGIQDRNFVSISEKLYEDRMNLYEKLNQAHVTEEN